jgi:molybdopterin-guanine dinucleotide biosynthesis protein A
MLGIVFCGGQSIRMGTDKGLIISGGKNWVLLAFEKLVALHIPVKVSINSSQKESYQLFFDHQQLIVDDESLKVGGPLLGLLSAHLLHPDEDLFILACDLQLMQKDLLNRLADAERKSSGYEAYVFTRGGFCEPLCAIYKSAGLKKMIADYNEDNLSKFSMKSVLNRLKVFELELSEEEQSAFKNFNTPN